LWSKLMSLKIVFDDPTFDGQLGRSLGYAYYGGADLLECLGTAHRIRPGDPDSWYAEWSRTADRLVAMAEASLAGGHRVSAREAYLRASNYYRTAYALFFRTPVDPRVVTAYERQTAAFRAAAPLFESPFERVAIPYEDTMLPGYFLPADVGDGPRPTIIGTFGYDSTAEELYFAIGAAAQRRGYHCLIYDGPGQGGVLVQQQLYMRPDWEHVVTPGVDYALTRPEVDPRRLVLFGGSFGGYLAPRAATAEHRLAACIANAAQYDVGAMTLHAFPPDLQQAIVSGDAAVLQPIFAEIMRNPSQAFVFQRGMLVHGLGTPWEYVQAMAPYTLKGIADRIQCPTFIAEAENDRRRGGGKELYDALTCPHKEYVLFLDAEGAGEHCEEGAVSLFHQRAFDWLDDVLAAPR
jgi:alpha-beta hydrolase superfamily lysophospholipase